jgi:GNAT superfamily N-acetyltransferase
MDVILELSDREEHEAESVIGDGLNAFNDEAVGYADRRALNVLVREAGTGKILGGVHGRTSLGLLFVDLVYLPQLLRSGGVGRRMMSMAEDEARNRGCTSGVLMTINFQAPGFYERLGWSRFGEVPCAPPGTSRIFLTKSFAAS